MAGSSSLYPAAYLKLNKNFPGNMHKPTGFIILSLMLVILLPVYFINKWMQKMIRPGESGTRLISYIMMVLLLIFVYTFLLVFIIKWLFPAA
jgi:hypothetical protein